MSPELSAAIDEMSLNSIEERIIDLHIEWRKKNDYKSFDRRVLVRYMKHQKLQNEFPYKIFFCGRAERTVHLNEFTQKICLSIGPERTIEGRKKGMFNRIISKDEPGSETKGIAGEMCFGIEENLYPYETLSIAARRSKDDEGDFTVLGVRIDVKATHHPHGHLLLPRWKVGDKEILERKIVVDWQLSDWTAYLRKIQALTLYVGDLRSESAGLFRNVGSIPANQLLQTPTKCMLGCDVWRRRSHCEHESFVASQQELRPLKEVIRELRYSAQNAE